MTAHNSKPVEDSTQIEEQTALLKQKINKLNNKLKKKNQDIQVVLLDAYSNEKNVKKIKDLTA